MLGFFVAQIGAEELPECLSGVSARTSLSDWEVLLPRFFFVGWAEFGTQIVF